VNRADYTIKMVEKAVGKKYIGLALNFLALWVGRRRKTI
jgi:hypothetical protein